MTKLGIWFVFFSWIFSFLANFRVFPGKKSCVQTHSIKQEWAYPLPTLCENFFWRMVLRNCASMAGFPKMEVNFHNFFRGFHSRMSWIWVKSLCKPYQTLPASSVHFLPLGPGSPVAPALLGTGDPGPRGFI